MVLLRQRKSPKPHTDAVKNPDKGSGKVDYEALAEFRYQLRAFLAFSDANAKNAGLTSQQYQALLTIKGLSGRRPMFVGEIARFLLIKHHTAVELVDRMSKSGLLQRTVDADDNRRVLVTLTKQGQLRLQKVATINFKHLRSSSLALLKTSRLFV